MHVLGSETGWFPAYLDKWHDRARGGFKGTCSVSGNDCRWYSINIHVGLVLEVRTCIIDKKFLYPVIQDNRTIGLNCMKQLTIILLITVVLFSPTCGLP